MKAKTFLVTILMAVVVFAVSYERGWAVDGDAATLRVGVVSVQRIFKESKKSASLREQAQVKRDQMEAELDKLAKEIEAKKAGLKTLKEDSSEYLNLMQEVLTETGLYQAKEKFYERQAAVDEQRMVEEIYAMVLEKTAEVAREKGLEMVLERSEPKLPAVSGSDLSMAISTHKVLFCEGCVDITEEVMERVN